MWANSNCQEVMAKRSRDKDARWEMALLAMEEAAANNRLTVAAGDGAYAASVLYNC